MSANSELTQFDTNIDQMSVLSLRLSTVCGLLIILNTFYLSSDNNNALLIKINTSHDFVEEKPNMKEMDRH